MRAPAKWILPVVIAGVASVAAPGAAAQELKIAVFDPQRVSEETAVGRRVQDELTALRDRKQAEITAQERKIGELQQQLAEQGLSLSPDRRSTMERDIQTRVLQLESARDVATRELQLEVAAAQSSFETKLLATVRAFGQEGGFTIVLTRDLVAWADKSVDTTDRIIERFNAMFPATEAAPEP